MVFKAFFFLPVRVFVSANGPPYVFYSRPICLVLSYNRNRETEKAAPDLNSNISLTAVARVFLGASYVAGRGGVYSIGDMYSISWMAVVV